MNKSDWEILINQYTDGEIEKSKEAILFKELSENEEARNYFKQLHSIKNVITNSTEEFPDYLEERILRSIDKPEQKTFYGFFPKNMLAVVSYAAVVVLMVVSIFLFFRANELKHRYDVKVEQVTQQNKMINLLYNSLPATEVVTMPDNQIVVKAKM